MHMHWHKKSLVDKKSLLAVLFLSVLLIGIFIGQSWSTSSTTVSPTNIVLNDKVNSSLNVTSIYLNQTWWNDNNRTDAIANPVGPYSFLIYTEGTNYFGKNGTDEQICWSSTNASSIIGTAIGNATGKGPVVLADGTYICDSNITLLSSTTLCGTSKQGTILKVKDGTASNFALLTAVGTSGSHIHDVYVHDLTLDGNNASVASNYVSGIYGNYVDNITVEACKFLNFNAAGMWFYTASGLMIDRNFFSGINLMVSAGDPDAAIHLTYTTNSTVTENQIFGCKRRGIDVCTGVYTVTISDNIIGYCSEYGISMRAFDCTVMGNTIYGCTIAGILLDQWTNNTVVNSNVCYQNVQNGIYCYYAFSNSISNNVITENGNEGIYFWGANSFNNIVGNTFRGNAYNGLRFYNCANNTVTSNYFMENSQATTNSYSDIFLYSASNMTIQGNTFSVGSKANKVQYAINVNSATCTGEIIRYNIFQGGCATANTYFALIPRKSVVMTGNIGYNPLGYIANPLYVASGDANSTIVDSGNNATWISARTYTNWGSPKLLVISGGTVTAIAFDGQTLFTSDTNCTFVLQPADTFSVTYSIAPTITVFGQ